MEIKTEHDIFWNYDSNTHKNKNKKWVSVESLIKQKNDDGFDLIKEIDKIEEDI